MRLVSIEIVVKSDSRTAGYRASFEPGFNVLNAGNSWGKSTLLQSIVYALGLEGAFSASRRVPLGPAMVTTIDLGGERHHIVESYVDLTIANDTEDYLRVRRYAKSLDVRSNLVRVLTASSVAELEAQSPRDMLVRESGAATRIAGFHRLLGEFIGWSLPEVPSYSDADVPLYLEVLLPLYFVEQKYGWSGIAPRVPTYLRVKDPLRRSIEYALGLSTLEAIRRKNELTADLSRVNASWDESVAKINSLSAFSSIRVLLIPERPITPEQLQDPVAQAQIDDEWINLSIAQQRWRDQIARTARSPVRAGSRTEASRQELASAESDVNRNGSVVRYLREELNYINSDITLTESRIISIRQDKDRLGDMRRIQRLGGNFELPLIAEGRCPTCQQSLDVREVATDLVLTLEDNISILDGELKTLESLKLSSERQAADIRRDLLVADETLTTARQRVRALRDELMGPSDSPSVVEIEHRLSLERQLGASIRAVNIVDSVVEELSDLSQKYLVLRTELDELKNAEHNANDAASIEAFRNSFQSQLSAYGFRSIRPDDVTIDNQSFLPIADGFELAFDVAQGSSASDTVRTKWAYHLALLEATQLVRNSHHLGILALDEPRQQEADRSDLRAFLSRLADNSQHGQILYFTSEAPDVLAGLLSDISVAYLPNDNDHLLSVIAPNGPGAEEVDESNYSLPDAQDVARQAVFGYVSEVVDDALGDDDSIVGRALELSLAPREEIIEVRSVSVDANSYLWDLVESFEGGTDLAECSVEADVALWVGLDAVAVESAEEEFTPETFASRSIRVSFTLSVTVTGESVEDLELEDASVVEMG